MYYKIVGPKFCFRNICPADIDILHIPNGMVFTSPVSTYQYEIQSPDHAHLDKAFIHFADGAFNTMLWYTWLFNKGHVQNNQIYGIEPLTPVIQARCPDTANLYQYGAHSIKILEKYDIKNMYDMAIEEFYKNKSSIAQTYPNLNLQLTLKAWKHAKGNIYFK